MYQQLGIMCSDEHSNKLLNLLTITMGWVRKICVLCLIYYSFSHGQQQIHGFIQVNKLFSITQKYLFNIYMDCVVREVHARMLGRGLTFVSTIEWKIARGLGSPSSVFSPM